MPMNQSDPRSVEHAIGTLERFARLQAEPDFMEVEHVMQTLLDSRFSVERMEAFNPVTNHCIEAMDFKELQEFTRGVLRQLATSPYGYLLSDRW